MASVPPSLPTSSRTRRRAGVASTGLLAVSTLGMLAGLTGTAQAATAVDLGSADGFAVLSGSGITIAATGGSTSWGDIGTQPDSAAPPVATTGTSNLTLAGTDLTGDPVMPDAKTDLGAAYDTAAGETPTDTTNHAVFTEGERLVAGVYNATSSMQLTGSLTLDAQGDPDAVFIFQADSTLVLASDVSVLLAGEAQACNVFWQVGSSATLGTDSHLVGTVLADTSITLTPGASVEGRLLARGGAVELDENVLTQPGCETDDGTPPVTTPPVTTPPVTTPPVTTPPVTTPPVATPTGTPPAATPTGTPPAATPRAGTPAPGRSDDRTTYDQIGRVPVGSVDTGDGSTS